MSSNPAQVILQILRESEAPLSAQEIARRLKDRGLATSEVAVRVYLEWRLSSQVEKADGGRGWVLRSDVSGRVESPTTGTGGEPNAKREGESEEGDCDSNDALGALLTETEPSAWIAAQLDGIWELVYEVGGPRCWRASAGPAALPPDVRNAWAHWADVADDSDRGRWDVHRLDTLPPDRDYERGTEWRTWVPTRESLLSNDEGQFATDGDPTDPSDLQTFERYVERYPFLADTSSGQDPHFAERLFLKKIAIPLLGRQVLERLAAQERFTDLEGKTRYCDFVLRGGRTYAIEIQGWTYHAEGVVGQEEFAEQQRRIQAYAAFDWLYVPIAFDDLVTGIATQTVEATVRKDPLLPISGDEVQPDRSTPTIQHQVAGAFHALQGFLLALYTKYPERDQVLRIEQCGLSFPLLELAIRDLDVLGTHACHLHGEQWTRPAIEVTSTGAERGVYDRLLSAYLGGAEADARVDRPIQPCPPLDVQIAGEQAGPARPQFELALNEAVSLDALWRIPPLPNSRERAVRRPDPANATPRILDAFARRLFGIPFLKEEQLELLEKAFRLESLLGVLPTGFGKSLCYQLPAYLSTGTLIVVSPLKSLMRDQLRSLRQTGLGAAELISSDLEAADKNMVLARLQRGKLKILYLSPERLEIRSFAEPLLSHLGSTPISFFAVDEAHCVSEWGHDFRPAYLRIAELARSFSDEERTIPILALTATASQRVRSDVSRVLRVPSENVVQRRSVDRRELSLSVHAASPEEDKSDVVSRLVGDELPGLLDLPGDAFTSREQHRGSLVIFGIYAAATGTTTHAEGIAHIRATLIDSGADESAVRLHSSRRPPRCKCGSYRLIRRKSPKGKRRRLVCQECGEVSGADQSDGDSWSQTLIQNQDEFIADRYPTLVATKGFGMGIDKPDIRAILHHCMPGGLEAYYQEGGRAGRDRKHAHAALVYRPPSESCVDRYFRQYGDVYDGEQEGGQELAPPCMLDERSRRFHKCPEGLDGWCDYARQANFIEQNFPLPAEEAERARGIFEDLSRPKSQWVIDCRNLGYGNEAARVELALYRLTLLGVVDEYWVSYPEGLKTKRYEVTLAENWILKDAIKAIQAYLERARNTIPAEYSTRLRELETRLSDRAERPAASALPDPEWIEAAVLLLVDFSYTQIRAMRYRMLHNLWRYAEGETKEEGRCRRWFLTTMLDAQEYRRPDDHRCEFCDVCVPNAELDFGERERAVLPEPEWGYEDLTSEIQDALVEDAYAEIDDLVSAKAAQRSLLSLRNLSLHHLEGEPDSLGAQYLAAKSSQLAARRDPESAYTHRDEAIRHATSGFSQLEDAGKDIAGLAPFLEIVESEAPGRAFDLMDVVDGAFDSLEGAERIRTLYPRLQDDPARAPEIERAVEAQAAREAIQGLASITGMLEAWLRRRTDE